jgi:ATP-binding protein involved in chromosome partitioning
MINKKVIVDALKSVADLDGEGDIVERGRIQDIIIKGTEARIELFLPTEDRKEKFRIEDQVREIVKAMEGVSDVVVITRGARTAEPSAKVGKPEVTNKYNRTANLFGEQSPIPDVKNIIAVASGKGGVGKSTVCVNLALALGKRGAKVGLLDADIYGPSLKVMLGVDSQPKAGPNKKIHPIEKNGLKLMSLAFLTDPSTPVIWRGPLVSSIMRQFLNDVDWGKLDYLLIDLPPGTGDAQLTLVQTVPLTAAIIVTTPSELALVDAEKGLRMFVQLNVPVLGIIENMSYFVCTKCGEKAHIFDHGGGKNVSEKYSTKFLGEIPLDGGIRRAGDSGRPVVIEGESSEVAGAFFRLADTVIRSCPVEAR